MMACKQTVDWPMVPPKSWHLQTFHLISVFWSLSQICKQGSLASRRVSDFTIWHPYYGLGLIPEFDSLGGVEFVSFLLCSERFFSRFSANPNRIKKSPSFPQVQHHLCYFQNTYILFNNGLTYNTRRYFVSCV